MSITWHVQDFKTLLFGENYINNKKNKIVIILMMPFVSAMNTSNGQKVDLKQDLRKKKWRLDILPQYLANLTLPVEN